MNLRPMKNAAFSLIELMVVVSILSFLVTLSIPTFAIFKIKAAQVEAITNVRTMSILASTYCDETHPTNCIISGASTLFEYGTAVVGPTSYDLCTSNILGFSSTNCQSLRYFYIFGVSSTGYYIVARGTYYVALNGMIIAHHGNPDGPPTRLCKRPSHMSINYVDEWIGRDGSLDPGSDINNALKNCF